MNITFGELLRLIPETQEVMLFESELRLQGSCDALDCLLSEEVLDYKVENIEADGDMLKVWINGWINDTEIEKG